MRLLSSIQLTEFADWWGSVLLHSLWIGALVGIVLAIIQSRLQAGQSNARYVAAVLALFSIPLFAMAVVHVFDGQESAENEQLVNTPIAQHSHWTVDTAQHSPDDHHLPATEQRHAVVDTPSAAAEQPLRSDGWQLARRTGVAVWLTGFGFMLLRLFRSHISAVRIIGRAQDPIPDWLIQMFDDVLRQLGLDGRITLKIGSAFSGPMVYGFLSSVVFIPATMVTQLSPEALRVVLCHELAHIRRRDVLVGFVERLIESCFFFNPAVWWICRQIRNEREAACDAVAVRVTSQPLSVATALLDTAEAIISPVPGVALAADGGDLEDRVDRLINPSRPTQFQLPWTSIAALTAFGVLAFGTFSVGTTAVAIQVKKALTPEEQVEAVAQAVETADPQVLAPVSQEFVTVTGRFVRPDGESIEECFGNYHADSRNSGVTGTLNINDGGTFEIKTKAYATVSVMSNVPGFVMKHYGPVTLKGVDLDMGDLMLDVGDNSSIRFVDETGQPVEGVKIERATMWDATHSSGMGNDELVGLISDADGVVQLEHVGGAAIEFTAVVPGFEYDRYEFEPAASEMTEWVLKRTAAFTGTLVSAETNQPVQDAALYLVHRGEPFSHTDDPRDSYLDHLRGKTGRTPDAVTNEAGEFTLHSLRHDTRYIFMAMHKDYQPVMIDGIAPGANLESINMEAPLVVRGQLKGDLSKLPKNYGRSDRYVKYRNTLKINQDSGSFGYDSGFRCDVAEDGSFEITQLFPGSVRLSIPNNAIELSIKESITDLVIDMDKPAPVPTEHRPLQVKLVAEQGQPLKGTVRLDWSVPKEIEVVGLRHGSQEFEASNGELEWSAPPGAVLYFRGDLLVGSWTETNKLGTIEAGDDEALFEVPLQQAGVFTGRIMSSDGSSMTNVNVSVDRIDKRHHFHEDQDVDHPDGLFAVGPLPLGPEHTYRAFLFSKTSWQVAFVDDFRLTKADPVYEQDVLFPKSVTVTGRVVNENGKPIAGARLRQTWSIRNSSRTHGPTIKTDDEGRFSVMVSASEVEGSFSVEIKPTEGTTGTTFRMTPADVAANPNLGDIVLKSGFTVRGRVVDESGNPVSKVHVHIQPKDFKTADYRAGVTEQVESDGTFVLNGLEGVVQTIDVFGATVVKVADPAFIRDTTGNRNWYAIDPTKVNNDLVIKVKKD